LIFSATVSLSWCSQRLWTQSGVEREKAGWCFSFMELSGTVLKEDGRILYEFRRHRSHPLFNSTQAQV
jgi:hypothetical protein